MISNTMKLALTFTATDAASGVLLGLEKKILGLGKAGQQVKKDFESMVSNMRAGIKGLAASWYILESLKAPLKITADTEESMAALEMTIARQGENAAILHEHLEKIRDTAGELQLLFPFGQKEMIDAATQLSKMHVDVADLWSKTGALYAAGALASLSQGKLDAVGGAKLVASGANIFGIKGDELGKMADFMQKIGSSTPLSLETQQQALGYGGAAANIKGMSFREALTAMGVAATQSGDPGNAGSRLDEFMKRLMGASKQEKKALDALGLHFYDKKGVHLPFIKIVEQLQHLRARLTAQKMTEEDIDKYFKQTFEGRGEYMAYYLSKTGKGSYQDIMATADASLTIEEKQKIASEDLNFQMRALTGSMKTLISDAFDPLLKDLTPIVVKINDLVGALDKFTKEHQILSHVVTDGIAAIGLAIGAWGTLKIVGMVWNLGKVLRGLGLGAAKVAGPAAELAKDLELIALPAGEAAYGLGLVAAGLELLPAAIAGVLAYLSKVIGKEVGQWQMGFYSNKQLDEMQRRNEVMGGGRSKEIDSEMNRRFGLQLSAQRVEDSVRDFERMRGHGGAEHRQMDKVADVVKKLKTPAKHHHHHHININVDQNGRVSSHSNDPNTSTTINLKRGRFLPQSFFQNDWQR